MQAERANEGDSRPDMGQGEASRASVDIQSPELGAEGYDRPDRLRPPQTPSERVKSIRSWKSE